jgi:hypothetical protein
MSELNESSPPDQPNAMSAEALARRSMLLKSLGKGSAVVVAASVPMHTLASSPTLFTADGTRCSISGMQSGNNSRITSEGICRGKSPGYWHKFEHWTADQKLSKDDKFGLMFGHPKSKVASEVAGATLYEIVCSIGNTVEDSSHGNGKGNGKGNGNGNGNGSVGSAKYNNTPEWHWCCAWMNAMANDRPGTDVVGFPYTPSQVIGIYQSPTSFNTTRAQALEFFKKLEN